MIRILRVRHSQEITQAMRDIGVDPYGSQIMLPKAISYLVRINSLSNITANILKQEMLSLGGDVAVSRLSLTGKANKTDCLLMGNLAQIKRLQEKLQKQPFRLGELASSLSGALSNYQKDKFIFKLGSKRLNLGSRTYIMGIVNLTPDSFSGDGLYQASDFRLQTSEIQEYIDKMIADGADIIDIGGNRRGQGQGQFR
jgi:dihydropteroate synthase